MMSASDAKKKIYDAYMDKINYLIRLASNNRKTYVCINECLPDEVNSN